jgi:hypothetical protein
MTRNKIKQKFKNKNFISPDLLTASTNGAKNIAKKEFSDLAKQWIFF